MYHFIELPSFESFDSEIDLKPEKIYSEYILFESVILNGLKALS